MKKYEEKKPIRMVGWRTLRRRPIGPFMAQERVRAHGKWREYKDGKLIKESVDMGFLDEIFKIGAVKDIPARFGQMAASLRERLAKHPKIQTRLPKFLDRTVTGIIRKLKKGGPTSWAVGSVLERPSRTGLLGGLAGLLVGLPMPPGLPGAMVLAPGGLAFAELPRLLRLRAIRKAPWYKRPGMYWKMRGKI